MMVIQLQRIRFIVRESWHFLGCDAGAGRWKARLVYVTGIVPVTIRFLWLSRNDSKVDWQTAENQRDRAI